MHKISLIKADSKEFIHNYAKYNISACNSRFYINDEIIKSNLIEDSNYFYNIYIGENMVGGVILKDNIIKHPFIKPLYIKHRKDILKYLHKYIYKINSSNSEISCIPSNRQQAIDFFGLGYYDIRVLRCMLGLLQKTNIVLFPEYLFRLVTVEDMDLIADLFYKANIHEPWHQPVTAKKFQIGTETFFNTSKTKKLLKASYLCYHKESLKAVGACFISDDYGLPLVYDLHVLKKHRRKGIATNLINLAANELNIEFSHIKLFVVDGNPAIELYRKLGFIMGEEIHIMKCTKPKNINA